MDLSINQQATQKTNQQTETAGTVANNNKGQVSLFTHAAETAGTIASASMGTTSASSAGSTSSSSSSSGGGFSVSA